MRVVGAYSQGTSTTMALRLVGIEFEYNTTALPLENGTNKYGTHLQVKDRKAQSLRSLNNTGDKPANSEKRIGDKHEDP